MFTFIFLDASKAFDKINHLKLFRKLLDRKTHILIVRILLFWYSKQTVCVNWGRCISEISIFLCEIVLDKVEFCLQTYFMFMLNIFSAKLVES